MTTGFQAVRTTITFGFYRLFISELCLGFFTAYIFYEIQFQIHVLRQIWISDSWFHCNFVSYSCFHRRYVFLNTWFRGKVFFFISTISWTFKFSFMIWWDFQFQIHNFIGKLFSKFELYKHSKISKNPHEKKLTISDWPNKGGGLSARHATKPDFQQKMRGGVGLNMIQKAYSAKTVPHFQAAQRFSDSSFSNLWCHGFLN